jgi:chromosome segregation ATPase
MSAISPRTFGVVLVSLLIVGCANPARQRSERAIASLDNTRAELNQGTAQVNDVLATLDQLESRPADLKPVFRKFVRQVDDLERQANSVSRRVRDMRVRSTDYSVAWQAENQTIANPDLRAAATQRVERVSDRYQQVDARAQEVRSAYDPFINELRDLETFLSNDLTYGGVNAAKPVFDTVRSRAAELKDRVADLVQELDETYSRLSPTTAPAR